MFARLQSGPVGGTGVWQPAGAAKPRFEPGASVQLSFSKSTACIQPAFSRTGLRCRWKRDLSETEYATARLRFPVGSRTALAVRTACRSARTGARDGGVRGQGRPAVPPGPAALARIASRLSSRVRAKPPLPPALRRPAPGLAPPLSPLFPRRGGTSIGITVTTGITVTGDRRSFRVFSGMAGCGRDAAPAFWYKRNPGRNDCPDRTRW